MENTGIIFSIIAGLTGFIVLVIQIVSIVRRKKSICLLLNYSTYRVREDLSEIPNFNTKQVRVQFIARNRVTRLNTYKEILENIKLDTQVLIIPEYIKEIEMRLKLIEEYKQQLNDIDDEDEKLFHQLIKDYKQIINEFR
ncbi:hypothetical protein PYH59_09880 [Mammaliicoccus lentus]|uniref:hypothetical protein n=1 Tax=Mammaliicoccus lentus TaxID=42858 RepID=UPI0024A7CFEA|nr:hypothetical protein [Mammaliicoccus lentus]WHI54146.1 hypothetical protein PYH59_09880 [Mammaliicoccus lentus]